MNSEEKPLEAEEKKLKKSKVVETKSKPSAKAKDDKGKKKNPAYEIDFE